MTKTKHILPLSILILLWGGLALCGFIKPDNEFSMSERRKLAAQPQPDVTSVTSGRYFTELEAYSLDQFPLRDSFRTLKSVSEFYLLRKNDNNSIYITNGYAVKSEYPLNESSIENASEKFNELYESYIPGNTDNVYLSVIPDKGYFTAEETEHLTLDYDVLFHMIQDKMPYAQYIDITSSLTLSDYYRTDSHWRQEELTDTAQILADSMGTSLSGEYHKITVEKPFYGVYYGQSALPLRNDTIQYLTNDVLDDCTMYNLETNETTGLYDRSKIESRDMYEVYLSGSSPLLTIENPNAPNQKALIVFRDSFASSIVPLLAEGYSKITLIDTRYIQPSAIGEYVDFAAADVLFLYSTTLLNNSQSLR